MNDCPYNEDYFLHGKETGKSLYENYRWLPDLTIPMAEAIVRYLGIGRRDTILDFGCARGYLVKALRLLGYKAYGVDTSEWAIENCDPDVKKFVYTVSQKPLTPYDWHDGWMVEWVIAKDVLEHVENISDIIAGLQDHAREGIFTVVPLANHDGGRYVIEEYERDVTHIHRLSLPTWASYFMRTGWAVDARYRVPGVKDNYQNWVAGNGFISARRTGG